jgi:hypothetical protein
MAIPDFYILHFFGESTLYQKIYLVTLIYNSFTFMPAIISQSIKKKKRILSPKVNNSYSKSSIYILNLLMISAWMVI